MVKRRFVLVACVSLAAAVCGAVAESRPSPSSVVEPAKGYNSWPMISAVGDRLVCAYSRGSAHDIGEGVRGVWARTSDDFGRTWSEARPVVDEPTQGEVTIGSGLDSSGAFLLWVRSCDRWRGTNVHHDLYRSTDGLKFERIASLRLDPNPMQITDIFAVPGRGLMALWFSGFYEDDGTCAWGTLLSEDDGRTWRQETVEKGLRLADWPTEPSAVFLGNGRILALARTETADGAQFQIVSTDSGRTWKRTATNITRVQAATPSLVYDEETGKVTAYYYQRGKGLLLRRTVPADFVFGHPTAWPEPEFVAKGSEVMYDAGNANAVRIGRRHFIAYYSGKAPDTGVYVTEAKRLDYAVTANGRPIEVYEVPTPEPSNGGLDPTNAFAYSYAPFELPEKGEAVVEVRCAYASLERAAILPASGDVERLGGEGGVLRLRVKSPRTFVIEPQGRHRALVLSPTRPDPSAPKPGDRGVTHFGPGRHRAGFIPLGSNETLYLAPGAYVDGWLQANGTNITVCGAGILSGATWKWHEGPVQPGKVNRSGRLAALSGVDITVRDTTFFSSWGWTLVLNAVTNVTVDNVKVVCGRVINDDGIDICRAHGVEIRNSFVRCQDDCITPKYWCTDLVCTNLTLWTDSANVFRAGYECEKGSTGLVYDNHLYRDIDILHLSLRKRPPEDYWANCAISLQPSNDQLLKNFVFEDIRFHEVASNDIFLLVKTMPTTTFEKRPTAGFFRGLTLRNIHLPACDGPGPCVFLQTHDDRHWIRDIRFEGVTGHGPVIRRGAVDGLEVRP